MKLNKDSLTGGLGILGENAACAYLEEHGFEVIERNFHCRYGEIDIICRKPLGYIFVEVKLRKFQGMTKPFEALNYEKLRKMLRAVEIYMAQKKHRLPYRLDMIGVEISNSGTIIQISHIKNILD